VSSLRGPVEGLEEGGVGPGAVGERRDQRLAHQAAPGLPPVERVAVMGQQHQPVGGGERRVEQDRGGEAAQEGGDDAALGPPRSASGQLSVSSVPSSTWSVIAKLRAVGAVERQKDGDDGGLLEGLAGGGGHLLRQGQGEIGTFDAPAGGELGRAGLRVPALELAEVAARCVLKHLKPILDRAGLPVMAVEIEGKRGVIRLRPHEKAQHADDLRALLVDGGGVEIVDLDIALGPDIMRERARILAELARAERQHIVDAFDRGAAHVGRELLIAEDGEALLQAELEPIAAGDAVAGPVVEVLMRDDALDEIVIAVGGGGRARRAHIWS
jgi:hypothetical protein